MVAAVFDSASLPEIEKLYAAFQADANSVSAEWRAYFLGFTAGNVAAEGAVAQASAPTAGGLAQAWRERGHRVAKVNPLREAAPLSADLQAETYGEAASETAKWQAIYGGSLGVECGAIAAPAERAWVQQWLEEEVFKVSPATRVAVWQGLQQANALEQFLHKKFVGAKRFSVEGVDVIVPLLQQLVQWVGTTGGKHVVLGMAHRGRLNVLCHVLGKPYVDLLAAFGDTLTTQGGPSSGDVKYHLGKKTATATPGGEVAVELLYNPSHLEAVNPSVLGVARAYADKVGAKAVLPVLIHGDSAVAGQGVVAEVNNLMQLGPYAVGGTVHVVLNNQVGFTANPTDAFTGDYCTDGFRALGVPIVHVNADDADACVRALRLAFEYRQQFGKDAVVDVVGYRRWGHNEGDDPTFTQPLMYEKIRAHPVPAQIYLQQLVQTGVNPAELQAFEAQTQQTLDAALSKAKAGVQVSVDAPPAAKEPVTTVTAAALTAQVNLWKNPPRGFVLNDKVQKIIAERAEMLAGEKPLNWGAAETAAYAALLQAGVSVRMTGQDVQRGTFSHRHAVLTSATDGAKWNVLAGVAASATCVIENSALSENAVLGFEYGYALAAPKPSLVIWEAQFGDFANGAQVVIDQFIASAHAKWGQENGLAILLPHGYEGQGPEHSSARLERFLQLCAEENMTVAYPTTPAQIFHLLRRQALHPTRRPLVVMTPKSLLRLPTAVSNLQDLQTGGWQTVLGDTVDPKAVETVVLCSGKIYYDLLARRQAEGRNDVALIRVEQLYPWPTAAIAAALKPFKGKDVTWVQEEPRNMGAWTHVCEYWEEAWGYLQYAGRRAAASPATGLGSRHAAEQREILDRVFGARAQQAA